MGKRRRLAMSDDEDDAPLPTPPPPPSDDEEEQVDNNNNNTRNTRNRRKQMKLKMEEGEEAEDTVDEKKKDKKKSIKEEEDEDVAEDPEEEEEEEEEEEGLEDAKPLGEPIDVIGRGRWKKSIYKAFEFDNLQYELEDPVLLVPEGGNQKPYVAIIKEIAVDPKGGMRITGQWFYRPEEAEKKSGGNWQSRDTRELFYSFHRDEVPAESVMHKCVVHFIPLHKQIPQRKEHPGFIVQKVYDTEGKRLFKLTDKDYEDNKQEEIDLLVQKTLARIGDLPDIEPEGTALTSAPALELEDPLKSKRLLRRKSIAPLEVSRDDDGPTRSGNLNSLKSCTPGSCANEASEYYNILSEFKVLTGETSRDKWLEKMLQGLQFVCQEKSDGSDESQDKKLQDEVLFPWPDKAVQCAVALENVVHEANLDFQKYNKKMRQLVFNFKSNAVLSKRFLNAELEPLQILAMSPAELKEGLTAEENVSRQPEESEHMQMTEVRCDRCMERKVGLVEIIGDRYQLECNQCGNVWYTSRDEAATLTMGNASSMSGGTGTQDAAEKLVSPRGTDPPTKVLENQASFSKATSPGQPDAE